MPDNPKIVNQAVIEANQKVHSQIASQYNESEPHFRPENQSKVRKRLEQLSIAAPSKNRMLDLGCGTGFLLNLASDLFVSLDGIDATQAMLDRVDFSPGNINVQKGIVEELPFESDCFDAVTAYSFIDHLDDPVAVFEEVFRVLKPGGRLYVDLIPNNLFWETISKASESQNRPLHPIMEREIDELMNHEEKLFNRFGIAPEDWRLTEPVKSEGNGFKGELLLEQVESIGFSCEIEYEWFLGQAVAMHQGSMESALLIENHLKNLLPASRSLFKYMVLLGMKPL